MLEEDRPGKSLQEKRDCHHDANWHTENVIKFDSEYIAAEHCAVTDINATLDDGDGKSPKKEKKAEEKVSASKEALHEERRTEHTVSDYGIQINLMSLNLRISLKSFRHQN